MVLARITARNPVIIMSVHERNIRNASDTRSPQCRPPRTNDSDIICTISRNSERPPIVRTAPAVLTATAAQDTPNTINIWRIAEINFAPRFK